MVTVKRLRRAHTVHWTAQALAVSAMEPSAAAGRRARKRSRICSRAASSSEARLWTYELVLRVWWAVRWARTLYEVPRGLDPRLAERGPGWQRDAEVAFAKAVERAMGRLEAEGVAG
jgi:hypothetical protein